MAAENCDIQPGDIIAVWGCGPVGQFAIRSAYMLGAARVIALDHVPERAWRWPKREAPKPSNAPSSRGKMLKELTGGRRAG